jgi:hypothetical protein
VTRRWPADGHDLARVHADARGEALAVIPLEVLVQRRERLPHPDRRPNRSEGVVLVETGDTENGHHGVSDELLDGPAVPLDHGGHLVEVPPHHAPEGLRIEPSPELR